MHPSHVCAGQTGFAAGSSEQVLLPPAHAAVPEQARGLEETPVALGCF